MAVFPRAAALVVALGLALGGCTDPADANPPEASPVAGLDPAARTIVRTPGEPATTASLRGDRSGTTWSGDKDANRADLEGMADFFDSIGATVGIYSTGSQWGQIVGQVTADSSLYDLPSWLAGARTATGAKNNCSATPLTPGGKVVLTQFVSKGFDYDYSCI